MLSTLITSKTRQKLLLKFFLNSDNKSYLRMLEQELGESSNAIRLELNKMEKDGLLIAQLRGNRKYFTANTAHPLFPDINNILKKCIGIHVILENIREQVANLDEIWVTGEFADGKNSKIIDLIYIGRGIDPLEVSSLTVKMERKMSKKIRYLILESGNLDDYFKDKPAMLIWRNPNS